MNAPANIRLEPEFLLSPQRYSWDVLIHDGTSPRTGRPQEPLEFRFPKRTRPTGWGYTRAGIIARAKDLAESEHRTQFMVRDEDGVVIYRGVSRLWHVDAAASVERAA